MCLFMNVKTFTPILFFLILLAANMGTTEWFDKGLGSI